MPWSAHALDSHDRHRTARTLYWTAILLTFALGTAAGDLATEAVGLGFRLGVVVFGAMIATVTTAYYLGANAVLCFWIGYILTRPRSFARRPVFAIA